MRKVKKNKVFRTLPKVEYLKEILVRLETEYIQILDLVNEYNHTHERGIGFWSLTRMIFPVIETVSDIIGKEKESFLEKQLGVPFGHLVWELYRHALMHSDQLRYAVYKGKSIEWAIDLSTEGGKHMVYKESGSQNTKIHIYIPALYYSLQDFLKKEISKNDTTPVNIQVGVHFPEHKSKLLEELEEICQKY